jgi:hypothetical protein
MTQARMNGIGTIIVIFLPEQARAMASFLAGGRLA